MKSSTYEIMSIRLEFETINRESNPVDSRIKAKRHCKSAF